MSIFAISFRIKADATYSDRWDSFVEAIRNHAVDRTVWEETTSFAVIEWYGEADALANSLYVGSAFNAAKDAMVVTNLSYKDHAIKGDVDYPNLLNGLMNKR